jgi:hypothetical protein
MERESPGRVAARIALGGPAQAWGTGAKMAQHSAVDERDGPALEHPLAMPRAEAPPILQAALRAHLLAGALDRARALADHLAAQSGQRSGLALLVDAALALGQVHLARQAMAQAEVPPEEAALLRAAIAQAHGDLEAARAILVAAIEAMPGSAALRRALAEVMVATGTAADARVVLNHLGAAPGPAAAGRGDRP